MIPDTKAGPREWLARNDAKSEQNQREKAKHPLQLQEIQYRRMAIDQQGRQADQHQKDDLPSQHPQMPA